MAKNDAHNRDSRNHDNRDHGGTTAKADQRTTEHHAQAERDRRRDRVVNKVKERPYTTAALATVAAGAAAFFLTRGSKSDKPLINWSKDGQGDTVKGAGAFKQGSTTSDRSLETASTSPSSSAGVGAGAAGTSPSAVQAATLSSGGASTSAAATGSTGSSGGTGSVTTGTSATESGFDDKAKTETKAGAISYGA